MALIPRGNMRYVVEVNGEPYASFIEVIDAWDYGAKWAARMNESYLGFSVLSVDVVDILNDSVEYSWGKR